MSKRIALYYRVSTDEQSTDPQRLELQEYCQRKGWPIAAEYSDTISGAKFTRTGLDQLMTDVRKRRIDVLLCVKLDRLGRSFPHLAQLIFEFDSNGVALICTSQPIDTSEENPAGRLIMHVLIAMAQFERSLIQERTRAGLKVARSKGVKFGRPVRPVTPACIETLQSFREGRIRGYRELARALNCSVSRAYALAKECAHPMCA
jgi:DNA invertase Pin-like site-specific DNA recombinase